MNYFKEKMRGKSPGVIIGMVIFGAAAIIGLAILFGFIIMWLWNGLMPELFGLPVLTYWQAVGLFILARILFTGGGGGGKSGKSHKYRKHDKWGRKHQPYAKEFFGQKCQEDVDYWQHYDSYWEAEGKEAYQDYVKKQNPQVDSPDATQSTETNEPNKPEQPTN